MNRLERLLLRPCRTPDALHAWIRLFLGLNVPRDCVCDNHNAPFEYIRRAYFEPAEDLLVWAPRGGGKTRLAAVATLLDLLHKPGCAVRILGGSLEQSLRMWEHLLPDVRRLAGDRLVREPAPGARRFELRGGGSAAVLTQSQRAVRGLRVQKLRCDEIELFDPDVWEAAQLVTRSRPQSEARDRQPEGGTVDRPRPMAGVITGAIEALSTFHRPFGLMQRLVDSAGATGSPRVIRWCLLEVLERCPPHRDCTTCPLWDDCQGVAKIRCDGFIPIDDAIALRRRVSEETWQAEMLCRRPSTRGCVFPGFDPGVHVVESISAAPGWLCLAVDFGFANPFVCLWVQVIGTADDSIVHVIDEYVQPQRTLIEHLSQIQSRCYGTVDWVACDPSGAARSQQTGQSPVAVLRRAGYRVRYRPSRVVDGLEAIRVALEASAREGRAMPPVSRSIPLARYPAPLPARRQPQRVRLFIHPRCPRLIRAMRCYRYAQDDGRVSELPIKDGEHDHLVDALRYFFVNRKGGTVIVSVY